MGWEESDSGSSASAIRYVPSMRAMSSSGHSKKWWSPSMLPFGTKKMASIISRNGLNPDAFHVHHLVHFRLLFTVIDRAKNAHSSHKSNNGAFTNKLINWTSERANRNVRKNMQKSVFCCAIRCESKCHVLTEHRILTFSFRTRMLFSLVKQSPQSHHR